MEEGRFTADDLLGEAEERIEALVAAKVSLRTYPLTRSCPAIRLVRCLGRSLAPKSPSCLCPSLFCFLVLSLRWTVGCSSPISGAGTRVVLGN